MFQEPISELTYLDRMEINIKTRLLILAFLLYEIFSTEEILSIATGKDRSQINRIVKKMCKEGLLLKSEFIEGIGRQKRCLIGITRNGVLFHHIHADLEQLEEFQPFMPSRISCIESVRHQLGLQMFKAFCFNKQYFVTHPCALYTTPKKNQTKPVPDAYLHLNQNGRASFALEYEITMKSEARYVEILKGYDEKKEFVIYLFDDEKTMKLIGLKLAKLMPKSWRNGPQRLLFGLRYTLIQDSVYDSVWEDPNTGYLDGHFYCGLSTVWCMLAQRMLVGDFELYALEFAKWKNYDPSIQADGVKYGSVDRFGQVVPRISVAKKTQGVIRL